MRKVSSKQTYVAALVHMIGQCEVLMNVLLSLKLKSLTLNAVQTFFNQYLHAPFDEVKGHEVQLLLAMSNEAFDTREAEQDLVLAAKTFLLFLHKNFLEEEKYLVRLKRDVSLKDNHGVSVGEVCEVLFAVSVGTVVLCDACKKYSLDKKSNFVLSLRPDPSTRSVSELLAFHFQRKLVLPETNCSFCKQDAKREFRTFIASTPRYVLLHLDNPDHLEVRVEDFVTIAGKIYALRAYTYFNQQHYTAYVKQPGDRLVRTSDMKALREDPLLKNKALLYLYEKMS